MKKILNFGVVLLAGTFLLIGCAGVKKEEAPAPGPANDLVKKEVPVQNAMKLLDRIQYGKTYAGDVSDEISAEEVANIRKTLDDTLLKSHMRSAEVTFSKEGEQVTSLVARDKEKKSHVICADVKATVVEKDEAAIQKRAEELEKLEDGMKGISTEKAAKEAELQALSGEDAEKVGAEKSEEEKAKEKQLADAINSLDGTLIGLRNKIEELKGQKEPTTTRIESDTLCYTFNKAELEKKIDSETSFSQEGVIETRYDAEGKTVSEAPIALNFDIIKDGSKISGSIERDEKTSKTTTIFTLGLKQDEATKGDDKTTNKEQEKTND